MEISNKVFFITGAAQGLGRGMAEAALKRGGKVFIADLNTKIGEETLAALQKEYGADNVRFGKCDVTKKDQFTATFQSAVNSFGHIDVMVNNAGIMNDKTWELMIAINVNAVIWETNLAMEHMRKDKGGRGGVIINTASVVGLAPFFWFPVYTATKHAVVGFTKSWASNPNMPSMGVRLACLCPSAADTNLIHPKPDQCICYDSLMAYLDVLEIVPVSAVGDAFIKLVQDEDSNGKLIAIMPGSVSFYTEQVLDPPLMMPKLDTSQDAKK
ncbi:15-hydroxyprostaglandin dehydrogenase [NAD(+)]-like isoform X4 [Gigantopelta aegis]|uniref:15-hydroxyprostaglandin dehydrogenase [NAD(+)]-like isoform X4 n=1 Tax=Gigantopelta aegis TaxID=1735272 RepID=UPI001B88976A|nr:15-hydroxyprostaglandin dehydrogenase [NAD(+)]-like isoform X4 [Gigantopelta aegis]